MTAVAFIRRPLRPLGRWLGADAETCPPKRPRLVLAVTWVFCTALLFIFRPGYTFPPFDVIDSWVYTGYQWDLHGHITEFGSVYYGSRLTLILPGAFLHSLLPPLAANICYKLAESAFLAAAAGRIAFANRSLPAAVLAVVLSVFTPQIIWALHADYMDMPVIMYGALALACITAAKDSRLWISWILGAGGAFACLGISNLSAIALPGLGIAAYHLLWTGWGFRRQVAAVGVYLAAVLVVLIAGGLVNLRLGGQFLFLKPQVDMIFYFHNNEQNPWTPANWDWIKGANWLVVPACTLPWGIVRSFFRPPADETTRRLIRALTAGLAVSCAVAVNLELRGVGVLAYSFYASLHLCLALPLLALCTAGDGPSFVSSPSWFAAGLGLLALAALLVDSLAVSGFLQRHLPFHPAAGNVPNLAAIGLMLAAGLAAGLPARFRRPELLLCGIICCSLPLGFHGPELSDRLPGRYASIHAAFATLARRFSPGSYRFWLQPDQKDGTSLASTMLYGYRLFTLQPFPRFEDHNVSPHTIVIPCLPGQGTAILAQANQVLEKSQIDMIRPLVIPIAGGQGIGMDLICFSMEVRDPKTTQLIKQAEGGILVMDLQFAANPPYTDEIIQTTFRPERARTIFPTDGYPLFIPTDPRDYLWTRWKPIPDPYPGKPRELILVATMPADGQCVCVVQTDGYREIRRIALTKHGQSAHLISVPSEATTLRIYLTTETARPTPLPTSLSIYLPR